MNDPGAKPNEMGGEMEAAVHYSNHNLREMFSRENAERRRGGGKMLRSRLTSKQDKQCMNKMVKLRDQFEVANNDDIILCWIKTQIDEGKADELDAELVSLANQYDFPARTTPWDDQSGH